jgi:hypothetical protein
MLALCDFFWYKQRRITGSKKIRDRLFLNVL